MSDLTLTDYQREYCGSVEIRQKLAKVARSIRRAIADLTSCIDEADSNSDVETRCLEALSDLEAAQYHVEWKPPADPDVH